MSAAPPRATAALGGPTGRGGGGGAARREGGRQGAQRSDQEGRMSLSTHVLDTARGEPAAGVRVTLYRNGVAVTEAETDADGRVRDLGPVSAGRYRLEVA